MIDLTPPTARTTDLALPIPLKDLCITSGFPRVGRFGKLAGKSLG